MTFWILAIAITAIACAALSYASAGRLVNAQGAGTDATDAHFRLQLLELEGEIASGRLAAPEALAAKAEMAREILRLQAEARSPSPVRGDGRRGALSVALFVIVILTLGIYGYLGHPDMPAQPLAQRQDQVPVDLNDAIVKIEAQLAAHPDDLRGWTVLAPVYMRDNRFADAVRAYRRILALAPPTADTEADLAEALVMQNGGQMGDEALALFESAAARDPKQVRSRFYLAAEMMRLGSYDKAVVLWNQVLAAAKGDEPWAVTARQGLAAAQAALGPGRGAATEATPDDAQIKAMVDGLAERLRTQGGSIDEWTQLVRSHMVLGDNVAAQADYDAARKAYPDPAIRTELDVLAADNGLVAKDVP